MSSSPDKEAKTPEVHSANSWETADLGDKSRNEKFLKLMGATKKEHHGRFVIGDKDVTSIRPKTNEKKVEDKLEEQYNQSMEHRLVGGRKGHVGFGFHEEDGDHKTEETEEKEKDELIKKGDDSESKEKGKDEGDDSESKEKGKDEGDDSESKEKGKDEGDDSESKEKGKNKSVNEGDDSESKEKGKDESVNEGGDSEKDDNRKRESKNDAGTDDEDVKKMKFVKSSS